MKFSIGYNHDIKLLNILEANKDGIDAIYFPIPRRYLGSGRAISQKINYTNEIPKIIKRTNSTFTYIEVIFTSCNLSVKKICLENDPPQTHSKLVSPERCQEANKYRLIRKNCRFKRERKGRFIGKRPFRLRHQASHYQKPNYC